MLNKQNCTKKDNACGVDLTIKWGSEATTSTNKLKPAKQAKRVLRLVNIRAQFIEEKLQT